jgi:nucleoid-associated protein YgaU
MARVIVILALMLAIAAAMFAITRKSAIAPGEAATEPSATVRLTTATEATPVVEADEEAESLKSAEPRTFSTPVGSGAASAEVATASAQDVTAGPVAGAAPTFGTAGIDNKGRASFTGTATPGDAISLLSNGKPVGSTKADSSGSWTLGFKPPKSSSPQELLVSAQSVDGTTVVGPQRAIIGPPETKGGLPNITLKAAAPAVAVPEATTGLVVENVTQGDNGLTMLRGKADPGATVKAAINDKPAGETSVASDGSWSLAASNLSGKNADGLQLQLLDKSGAKLDETKVPYKVPASSPQLAVAETKVKADFPSVLTSSPKPRSKPTTTDDVKDFTTLVEPKSVPADGQAEKATVVKVRRGDSLWRIARRHLGKGKKWAKFYAANKEKIDNPDLIYPGQVLIIPA